MNSVNSIKKQLPDFLFFPDHKKSWTALIRVLLCIGILEIGIYYTYQNLILGIFFSFFIGLAFVGLFVLGHDCAHYSFQQKKWINEAVGIFVFTPLLNSFFGWREGHNLHHRYTQVKKVDPDWPEMLLTPEEWENGNIIKKSIVKIGLGTPVGIILGFWVGMIKRLFFPIFIPQMKLGFKKSCLLFFQNICCLILSIAFITLLYQSLDFKFFIFAYLLPSFMAAAWGALLTWLQHSHADAYVFDLENYDYFKAQVLSTFNVRFPKLFEFFWLDINIHLPHHISPKIPWYHLKESLHEIKRISPDLVLEMPISMKLMTHNWRAIHLRPNQNVWSLSTEATLPLAQNEHK